MRSFILAALLSALTPCLSAQRMISNSPRVTPSFAAPAPSPGFAGTGFAGTDFAALHRLQHAGHPRSFFYPVTFSDLFYSDYLSRTGYPAASQPPIIILQAPSTAAPQPDGSSQTAEPLMIELQGDRYVRVSGGETTGTQMIDPTSSAHSRSQRSSETVGRSVAPAQSVPAVLVFRDGHREEVSDFTIANGVLYSQANLYIDGTWNRQIELSSLNLPETVKSNQLRGVRFRLPTSPNEVIVRP